MKNLSLNAKFVSILSIFVVAAIVIAVLGISKLGTLNDALNNIVQGISPRIVSAKNIEVAIAEIKNQEKVFILEPTKSGMEEIGVKIDGLEEAVGKELVFLKGVARLEATKRDLEGMTTLFESWTVLDHQMRDLSLAGKNKEAEELARGAIRANFDKIDDLIDAIVKRNNKLMVDAAADTDVLYAEARSMMIIVSLVAVLLGMTLAFIVLRSLNSSINAIINGLKDSANQVTSAAQQIAASSEELSQGATEQASSLEETSSAVEEMNSMVQRNAESARTSTTVAQTSGNSASRGKKVVDDMKQAMVDINRANASIMQQTTESNQKISEIVQVISEIGNKTKVINDIVFQTKLLSFNASVEAARAGEHGKGFAVVAEEVGNLAQMSGNAAKEISNLLESSIHKVESIVSETKTSVEKLIAESKSKVDLGTKVASDCGVVLDEIVKNVTEVTQMSQSIATASDEQARGISEITKAVGQLDQMTQQNAAASEETASAAEELSAQADSMVNAVHVLIVTIKGGEQGSAGQNVPMVQSRMAPAKAPAPRSVSSSNNVVHLGRNKKAPVSAPTFRMAAGSDVIPSEDDPRFKDI